MATKIDQVIKDIDDLHTRMVIAEKDMIRHKTDIQAIAQASQNNKLTCELPSYKTEMVTRCKALNDKIDSNKEIATEQKHNIKNVLAEAEIRCDEKIKTNRTLIGRLITACIILGICLVGVIGTIQNNKVGQAEYDNHLVAYESNRQEALHRFNRFMEEYQLSRQKRDDKIDLMLDKQQDFNTEIVKSNLLLEKQLDILKAKLDMK